ncbi:hypothetical protein OS493_036515 [Desmophyllum pertusum]|uniref:Uncharacterized protein n=1 Tax=Desmophyllum pertusum TaxID=174260 RepID=A0A9X0D6U0_9CNID|nr:hypothetical protein OS493_036515 [Desmophyllum pertusum]
MEGPIHLVMSTGQVVGPNTTPMQWFKECVKQHVQFSRLKKFQVPYIMYQKDLAALKETMDNTSQPQEDDGDGNDDDDDKIKVRLHDTDVRLPEVCIGCD